MAPKKKTSLSPKQRLEAAKRRLEDAEIRIQIEKVNQATRKKLEELDALKPDGPKRKPKKKASKKAAKKSAKKSTRKTARK